jgi:hypothetical protein
MMFEFWFIVVVINIAALLKWTPNTKLLVCLVDGAILGSAAIGIAGFIALTFISFILNVCFPKKMEVIDRKEMDRTQLKIIQDQKKKAREFKQKKLRIASKKTRA